MANAFKNSYYKPVSMYRIAICVGLFVLLLFFATVMVMNQVQKARYHVALSQALSILSEAMLFTNFESDNADRADVLYYYFIDVLNTKFDSIACDASKELVCQFKEYRTLNDKAKISDTIYRGGRKIGINNILFLVNKPKFANDNLLIMADVNGGTLPPNRLGYDLFVFQIKNNKVRAMGNKMTAYPLEEYSFYCNKNSKSQDELLGINCTYSAFFEKDYFRNLGWVIE